LKPPPRKKLTYPTVSEKKDHLQHHLGRGYVASQEDDHFYGSFETPNATRNLGYWDLLLALGKLVNE